jgi:hypothetical protein
MKGGMVEEVRLYVCPGFSEGSMKTASLRGPKDAL